MTWRPAVLLVAPTAATAISLWSLLAHACEPTLVRSFRDARRELDRDPSVLVSEVRLGEYNGLHLALRAHAKGIPVILLGEPDPVLERDARQLGAIYLPSETEPERLLALIESTTAAAAVTARPVA